LQRRYDLAIAQARQALELDPNYFMGHSTLGLAYGMKGMWSEATATLEKCAEVSGRHPGALASLGWSLALAGRGDEARRLLAELEERSRVAYVSPAMIGFLHLGLGETDQAFNCLEKAIEIRDPMVVPIDTLPTCDPLRPDPRFHALLRKMNLEA